MNINGLSLQQFISVTSDAYLAAASECPPPPPPAAQPETFRKLLADQLAQALDALHRRSTPMDPCAAMMLAGVLRTYTGIFRALGDKRAENWCRIKAIIITRDWTRAQKCIGQVHERLIARA